MIDPRSGRGEGDAESIIVVREPGHNRQHSRRSYQGNYQGQGQGHTISTANAPPYLVRALEELDARALAEREGRDKSNLGRLPAPTERGKIFKVIETEERHPSRQGGEDVQILRLDEDTGREETYRRLGDSEILSLDHGSTKNHAQQADPHGKASGASGALSEDKSPGRRLMVSRDPRRTRSEQDLVLPGDLVDKGSSEGGGPLDGEFYTAVGPDGKEIILRRYLNDQSPELDPYADRGFLNMAMYHLQQEQDRQDGSNQTQLPPAGQQSLGKGRSVATDG